MQRHILPFLVAGLALTLAVGTISAADQAECFKTCKKLSGVCSFDAKEGESACLDATRCETQRDAYIQTCLGGEPDVTACDSARASLRKCVKPCREEFRATVAACHETMKTCLQDSCGVEPGK